MYERLFHMQVDNFIKFRYGLLFFFGLLGLNIYGG
jgi:hypothetical protein